MKRHDMIKGDLLGRIYKGDVMVFPWGEKLVTKQFIDTIEEVSKLLPPIGKFRQFCTLKDAFPKGESRGGLC